jgi:hypothetical protein
VECRKPGQGRDVGGADLEHARGGQLRCLTPPLRPTPTAACSCRGGGRT